MARHFERIISALVLLALSLSMCGQSGEAYGAYSPYSIFGIGDISKEAEFLIESNAVVIALIRFDFPEALAPNTIALFKNLPSSLSIPLFI